MTTPKKPAPKQKPRAQRPNTPNERAQEKARHAAKKPAARKPKVAGTLTTQQALFVSEYMRDLNGSQAAIRAGYSARTAAQIAYDLLSRVHVQAAIDKAMAERAEKVAVSQEQVLRELVGIAMADTNELVEHRIGCCRFCHGAGNLYQRTPAEMARDRAEHEQASRDALAKGGTALPPFDEAGGTGFNATLPPNPDCPECFGQGQSRPVFKDTRLASPGAKSLYAGFKQTKDGMEIKLHPKDKALELLGRHLAMWNDKIKHQGDAENPINLLLRQMGAKSALPVVREGQPDEAADQ